MGDFLVKGMIERPGQSWRSGRAVCFVGFHHSVELGEKLVIYSLTDGETDGDGSVANNRRWLEILEDWASYLIG